MYGYGVVMTYSVALGTGMFLLLMHCATGALTREGIYIGYVCNMWDGDKAIVADYTSDGLRKKTGWPNLFNNKINVGTIVATGNYGL